MKRWIALCLIVVLLTGCTQQNLTNPGTQATQKEQSTTTTSPITTTEPTTPPTTLPELKFSSSFCNFGENYGYTYDTKRSYTTE